MLISIHALPNLNRHTACWSTYSLSIYIYWYWAAAQQNQQNNMHPAKTQISLGIRPFWLASLLSAWRILGSLATYWAHSEDWSGCADAQADLSLCWAHRSFCWFCRAAALELGTNTYHCKFRKTAQLCCCSDYNKSLVMRKPVLGMFDQVRLKPACSAIETR